MPTTRCRIICVNSISVNASLSRITLIAGEHLKTRQGIRMTKATKQSWHNLKAFTVDWQRVELNLTLDEAQMRNLEMGFIPPAMEYKWFIYFENNVLHLYRSWTGYKVAEVVFEKREQDWHAPFMKLALDTKYWNLSVESARESIINQLLFVAAGNVGR